MSSFRVTAGRDGSRSFGAHDDRTVRDYDDRTARDYNRDNHDSYDGGQGRGGRGRGGRYNKNYGKKKGYSRGGYRGRGRGASGGPGPRSRIEDDDGDVSMGQDVEGGSRQRFSPYGRPDSRRGNRSRGGRPMSDSEKEKARRLGVPVSGRGSSRGRSHYNDFGGRGNSWFKISIPHGKKAEKEFVMNSINRIIDVPFVPMQFHYESESAVFFVHERRVANALRNISRRITMPNGFKMIIITREEQQGRSRQSESMPKETIEKMKVAMSSRYDPASKALNLSDFYNDQALKADNLRLPLSKTSVCSQVLKIIGENIPELTQLDLSTNRIARLDNFSSLFEKAPGVLRINLGNNLIRNEYELDHIKQLKLEELFLEGNDLCDRFEDQASYISAIRKRFPKVLKLDGHDLPPPVTFDIETPTTLPPTQGNFFPNDQAKQLVCLFLEQYYQIFDGGNRQSLVDAYHDEALFSYTYGFNNATPSRQANFNDYYQDARNLIRIKDAGKLHRNLKVGKNNIVSLLTQLPSTQHDPNSFVVDISHTSPNLMVFTVHGIFKETESKTDRTVIRYFSRTFTTVPQGSGIVITNDEYSLTNATQDQVEKSFRNPAPTPSSSPIPGPSSSLPPTITPELRWQMVTKFSTQSNMNMEWSEKCLEQNEWDYDKAARVFTELHAKGSIPAVAFVKTT